MDAALRELELEAQKGSYEAFRQLQHHNCRKDHHHWSRWKWVDSTWNWMRRNDPPLWNLDELAKVYPVTSFVSVFESKCLWCKQLRHKLDFYSDMESIAYPERVLRELII